MADSFSKCSIGSGSSICDIGGLGEYKCDLDGLLEPAEDVLFTEDQSPAAELLAKEEENGPFYFESHQHALKENEDYQKLMKALVKLESQRIQAVKDLEVLAHVREDALANPAAFIQSLREGTLTPLPRPQQIVPVPAVSWTKYNRNSPPCPSDQLEGEEPQGSHDNRTSHSLSGGEVGGAVRVRGRALDEDKPGSFNLLWSAEEQTTLEYLLQVYPSEKKEVRRWEKIANALGNRTPKQVASRVQKYFIKLAKAGLSVPGRLPKVNIMSSNKPRKRKRTVSHARMEAFGRKTTFFATFQPDVYMPEDEEEEDEDEDDCGSQGTSSGGPSRQEPADFTGTEDLWALGRGTQDLAAASETTSLLPHSPTIPLFADEDYLGFETEGLEVDYNYLDTNFIPGR